MQNEKNMPGHVLRELHRFLERNKKTRRTKKQKKKHAEQKNTRSKKNTLTSQMVGILSAESPSLQTGPSRNQVELLIADVKPLKLPCFWRFQLGHKISLPFVMNSQCACTCFGGLVVFLLCGWTVCTQSLI